MATKKRTTTTPATRTRGSKTAALPRANGVNEDLIRERAYFLSLQRDGGPADPMADWIRAERELTAERSNREQPGNVR